VSEDRLDRVEQQVPSAAMNRVEPRTWRGQRYLTQSELGEALGVNKMTMHSCGPLVTVQRHSIPDAIDRDQVQDTQHPRVSQA
jgi:hypothetical protein